MHRIYKMHTHIQQLYADLLYADLLYISCKHFFFFFKGEAIVESMYIASRSKISLLKRVIRKSFCRSAKWERYKLTTFRSFIETVSLNCNFRSGFRRGSLDEIFVALPSPLMRWSAEQRETSRIIDPIRWWLAGRVRGQALPRWRGYY